MLDILFASEKKKEFINSAPVFFYSPLILIHAWHKYDTDIGIHGSHILIIIYAFFFFILLVYLWDF